MLSILIPTFNYFTFPLVEELHKQATLLNILFEIIVIDDKSELFVNENEKIGQLSNCNFIKNKENFGRTYSRLLLAEKSKYTNLLFLDADVIPEKDDFIKKYIEIIPDNYDVVFGGYKYNKNLFDVNKSFRYFYGINREEKEAEIRNKKKYSYIFSGNFFIKKDVFIKCNFTEKNNLYGMDIYFSYKLFIHNYGIFHIDNSIFHNGLDENEVFFYKSMKSVESRKKHLLELEKIGEINSLLKHYLLLKKLKLTGIVSFVFKILKKPMKKAILCKNPNLFVFDLYRLGYICYIK